MTVASALIRLMAHSALQGWCINTCKDKANEIMAAAKQTHPEAILRVVSPDAYCENCFLQGCLSAACSTCANRCFAILHSMDLSEVELCSLLPALT